MRLASEFGGIGLKNTDAGGRASRKSKPIETLGHCLTKLLPALYWLLGSVAIAQVNGVGDKPYLGWSSFPEQTVQRNFLTQANMTAQSDALLASGLQAHGFRYINLDSGWQGSFDGYGRPIPNSATFPDISALVAHIHQNGQKAGIYWIPGVEYPAVAANSPILGTPYHIQDILAVPYRAGNAFGTPGTTSPYHYKIDFTKPGAQEYMNSVADLFASWGFDLIKLDGVTPGSYSYNLSIDNRADVEAWSQAIAQSGRPIWLTVSWALDEDYLSTWQQFANARRIEGDVDCEGNCATTTNWALTSYRFYDLVGWQSDSGVTLGWNDLDSLEVGDASSGLSEEERRSATTLWAMANAPMYLGGDLTTLDDFGKQLLSNDEVIAVDQSGHPARQILGGHTPVWASALGEGTYYVGLFNLNAFPSLVDFPWSSLGFADATQVRDLWNRLDLGDFSHDFRAVIPGHGARLLKLTARGNVGKSPSAISQSYEAESATLHGTAVIANCLACSGGAKVGGLCCGSNNYMTFENVVAPRTGTYLMQIDSMTEGPRSLLFRVNGGHYTTVNVGGGSFFLPSSTIVPVELNAGVNSVQFGNPMSYAPDMDRIVISGDGSAFPAQSTTYEAENATLEGGAGHFYCEYCSGAAEAGFIGGGSGNNVLFSDVTVPVTGTYDMEIDYLTSGPRSFFMSVNGGPDREMDLNGSSFSLPTSIVIPVQLKAGSNTIKFGNPSGYAPALDRIAIPLAPAQTTSDEQGANGMALRGSREAEVASLAVEFGQIHWQERSI
jgi:alpha-galactosidase